MWYLLIACHALTTVAWHPARPNLLEQDTQKTAQQGKFLSMVSSSQCRRTDIAKTRLVFSDNEGHQRHPSTAATGTNDKHKIRTLGKSHDTLGVDYCCCTVVYCNNLSGTLTPSTTHTVRRTSYLTVGPSTCILRASGARLQWFCRSWGCLATSDILYQVCSTVVLSFLRLFGWRYLPGGIYCRVDDAWYRILILYAYVSCCCTVTPIIRAW